MKPIDEIIYFNLNIPGRDIHFRLKKAMFMHLSERAKQYCKTQCGANLIILFLQDEFAMDLKDFEIKNP